MCDLDLEAYVCPLSRENPARGQPKGASSLFDGRTIAREEHSSRGELCSNLTGETSFSGLLSLKHFRTLRETSFGVGGKIRPCGSVIRIDEPQHNMRKPNKRALASVDSTAMD